jgi:hypothetical protein
MSIVRDGSVGVIAVCSSLTVFDDFNSLTRGGSTGGETWRVAGEL